MKSRNGFTLIELLVVIAIIGILAAIIFPVYAQAKKGAYKSSDLSNMNSLRTALQLYKADNGAFPPALLGYTGAYSNNVQGGNVVPPNSIREALYPKRVESLSVFRPALNRIADNPSATSAANLSAGTNAVASPAYWPAVGSAFLNGGGSDVVSMQKQKFDGSKYVRHLAYDSAGGCIATPSYFYRISGYDAAPRSNTDTRLETHYQLYWSAYAVPDSFGTTSLSDAACDGTGGGSGSDTPRQLGYTDPPETTVVTWDSFFRDYQNGAPLHQKQDLVLFLAGNARPMDSANVATQAWAIQP